MADSSGDKKRGRSAEGPRGGTPQRDVSRVGARSSRWGASRRWVRGAAWLAVVLAVGGSTAFGLKSLESHVAGADGALVAPTTLRVRLSPIPPWMPWSLARRLASGVVGSEADYNDPALVQSAYERLEANPWVRSADRVRKQRDAADPLVGILEVQARFREPMAVVLLNNGQGSVFVDEECAVLPEEAFQPGAARWEVALPASAGRPARVAYYWDRGEVPQGLVPRPVHYILVEGVQAEAPSPGRRWEGQDIADGVRLVKLLRDKPYADQIVSVDVRNHGGRVLGNSGKPHIAIHARSQAGEAVDVWFGRFPATYGDYVLSVERRLASLDDYVHRCGGFFGAHHRVDLQYDRVHVE